MVNQSQVNVVPSGIEDREFFVGQVNEIIKLREIVQSAKVTEVANDSEESLSAYELVKSKLV